MGPSSDHVSCDIVTASQQQQQQQQHHIKCELKVPLKCPRCESANTKFCYYNNYSKSQPRHYCRVCRRHWTEGGVLRDVPVGGLRKSKRRRSSKSPPPTADGAANDAGASADQESSVQTPLRPTQFPPLDSGVAWFSYPPPPPPATANYVKNSAYDVDVANLFASISSTSSSGLSPCNLIGGVDEESLAAFDEQTKAWSPPPPPLPTPAEYWGEITDLVTLELNSSSSPDRLMEGSWIDE